MKWKVGDATITKVTEIVYPEFSDVIPAATPEYVKKVKWLFPHFVTPEGKLTLSIHSLVVDTPAAKLVVDTCIGNDRNRDPMGIMSNLATPFLEDMIAAGYKPEGIDFVLCTHLHLDHVGWNTKLVNGKWVPTFPKAKYLFNKKEMAFYGNLDPKATEDFVQVQRRVWDDSVKPILDAGLAKEVDETSTICPGVSFESTPGHTPGHCSVLIESKGEKALITGDCIHHPVQFHDPGLVTPFDVDNNAAVATRRKLFAKYADTPTLVIGTHFAGPTAGKLVRDGDGYRLDV